jgi:tRNA-splicing ligase RtcB
MTNSERNYEVLETPGRPVKAWIKGVAMEPAARQQLANIASLPFIHKWVAAMPDVHAGKGATVGSVIATHGPSSPRRWAWTSAAA